MEEMKNDVSVVVKSYHDVREVINSLKLPLDSPPVLSCIEWHKRETDKLLKEMNLPEEKIRYLSERLLSEEESIENKLKLCEELCAI